MDQLGGRGQAFASTVSPVSQVPFPCISACFEQSYVLGVTLAHPFTTSRLVIHPTVDRSDPSLQFLVLSKSWLLRCQVGVVLSIVRSCIMQCFLATVHGLQLHLLAFFCSPVAALYCRLVFAVL